MSPMHAESIARQIRRNRVFCVLLAGAAILNAAVVAALIGVATASSTYGAIVLAVIGMLAVGAWFLFERLVRGTTAARQMTEQEARRLTPLVDRLARRMDIAPPGHVLIMDDRATNAFALGTGPRAAIVLTRGLLGLLSDDELEGVVAHELAHIAHKDTRITSLSVTLLGWALLISASVAVVAQAAAIMGGATITGARGKDRSTIICMGFCLILAAIAAFVVGQVWFLLARITHFGISRQREWMADATAVRITGNPLALCRALQKIARAQPALTRGRRLVHSLCIVDTPPQGSWWADLLSTHPSVERRIERLRGYVA